MLTFFENLAEEQSHMEIPYISDGYASFNSLLKPELD